MFTNLDRHTLKLAVLLSVLGLGTAYGVLPVVAGTLETAQAQYDACDFKGAAATLRAAMYKGQDSNARTWLLLAKSYSQLGETGACRQTVAIMSRYFPGTAEVREAEKLLTAATSGSQSKKAEAPAAVAPTVPFEERITKIPPQFGHAAVSDHTMATVKRVVKTLPPTIYKVLDKGGAQIFVTPNLIDKFPGAVKDKHSTLGHYFSEEFGRTYGKDMYICESVSSNPGTAELGPPLHVDTIIATTYTMLSHALDCCLETPSKDPQYLRLYNQDVADHQGNVDKEFKIYFLKDDIGPRETFSGLTAGIMGANTQINRFLDQNFPRARAWIITRIKLVAGN